ncbi:hypothetical protein FMUAM8_19500 [Nocardia cyriacigeorgica]|nr:hypothetical protein FMUAM8_19500 [Nocardia cyriacigeorgica]
MATSVRFPAIATAAVNHSWLVMCDIYHRWMASRHARHHPIGVPPRRRSALSPADLQISRRRRRVTVVALVQI